MQKYIKIYKTIDKNSRKSSCACKPLPTQKNLEDKLTNKFENLKLIYSTNFGEDTHLGIFSMSTKH